MEVRTIFFNGPKGHRWVTAPVPIKSNILPHTDSISPLDRCLCSASPAFLWFIECDALHGWQRHGVTPVDDVRKMLRKDIRRRADVPLLTARVGDCRGRSAGDA